MVCCGFALLACQKSPPANPVQAEPYGVGPQATPLLGPGPTDVTASGEYGVSRDVHLPPAWAGTAPGWAPRYSSEALGYGDPVEDPWSELGCVGPGPCGPGSGGWGPGMGARGGAAWPGASVRLHTPTMVARHAADAGVSADQLAKIRSDYYATQARIGEQHWRMQKARLELGRLMGERRPDEAAIRRQLDQLSRSWAEAKKQRVGLLLRTQQALSPEQRAKLDELGARSSRSGGWRRAPGLQRRRQRGGAAPPGGGRGRAAPGSQQPAAPTPPASRPEWF